MTETVAILGSTGSIGLSTLEVVRRHPDRYRVGALSANSNVENMTSQCVEFQPDLVVMSDQESAQRLARNLDDSGLQTRVEGGAQALCELASASADTVVCGIVGAAGLLSTLAAVRSGSKVLIANKEPLVMLGETIMNEADIHGATVIPLDSEHNAIFQCLPDDSRQQQNAAGTTPRQSGIRRIWLTGSGGPFRDTPGSEFSAITPEQACRHPNWDMGPKISVDSATMMNKGLELIEASVLFPVQVEDVEIVVHPQSVVHSMVEYIDGSILAQLGSPDMRVPIAHALAWPRRIESGARRLDLLEIASLEFEAPDPVRFPAIRLAREAARTGGTLPAVMNAANEVAVQAFLTGELTFDRIPQVVERTMDHLDVVHHADLDTVLQCDERARQYCRQQLPRIAVAATGTAKTGKMSATGKQLNI